MKLEKILDESGLFVKNEICTYTGKYIDVMDPDPHTIDILDIAHALSHQVRFAGHLPKPYTVAQHCIHVCEYVLLKGAPKNVQLAALLHDASEAYMIDVPSPIKSQLFNYVSIEGEMMDAIAVKFNLPYEFSERIIKEADSYMLRREWHEFKLRKKVLEPLPVYNHITAKNTFLKLFKKLTANEKA